MSPSIFEHATRGRLLVSTRRFLAELAGFSGRRGVSVACAMTLGAFLEGTGLTLIVPVIQIVSGGSAAGGRLQRMANSAFAGLGAQSAFSRLAWLLGAFVVLMAVRAWVISWRDVAVNRLQLGFLEAHRLRIATLLASSNWERVSGLRHARITHAMGGDIQRVGMSVSGALQFITAGAFLLVQCALALAISPLLASAVLALTVMGAFALRSLLRRAHAQGELVTDANLALLDGTAQFLGGLKLALSQNLQASFLAEFEKTLVDLGRRQIAFVRQMTNSRQVFATITSLLGAVAVLIGFGMLHLSAPYLIVFLLILARMTGPAAQIQQASQNFVHGLPAFEKLKELECELSAGAISTVQTQHSVELTGGAIEFEQVSYCHGGTVRSGNPDDQCNGVRRLDLTVGDHEFIGVVGPSGSGKTTFADLLAGLIAPQSGQIRLGSAGLCGAVLDAWRNRIGYVGQEPYLLHDTVRRNLSWAEPAAKESEMWAALALCGADGLVRSMAGGLDAIVGERGALMSGGERQRLALARAILRKPRMLILDEATNAIDIAGEREILRRLVALTPRPAIVMIAHRTESIALCDRIIRFEDGHLPAERRNVRAATGAAAEAQATA